MTTTRPGIVLAGGSGTRLARESRQGLRIGCPEEIAWQRGWIDTEALQRLAYPMRNNGYGLYLQGLAGA